jgi:hypothetical protein
VILVRAGEHISLAVAEVLNFRQGTSTKNLCSVPTPNLYDKTKSTTVVVQLLELKPHFDAGVQVLNWEWTGDYLKIAEPTPTGALTDKHVALQTKAHQFIPLVLTRTSGGTWSFSHSTLQNALDDAWVDIEPDKVGILSWLSNLPPVDPSTSHLPFIHPNPSNPTLPYSLFIQTSPVSLVVEKLAKDAKPQCKLCSDYIFISDMRNQVGFHILKAHRGVEDPKTGEGYEVGLFPCRWCGLKGNNDTFMETPHRCVKLRVPLCEHAVWQGSDVQQGNSVHKCPHPVYDLSKAIGQSASNSLEVQLLEPPQGLPRR